MSTAQVCCPECSSTLQLANAVPAGAKIRCLKCKAVFDPNANGPVRPPAKSAAPRAAVKAPPPLPSPVRDRPAPKRKPRREADSDDDLRAGQSNRMLIGAIVGFA